VKTSSKSTTDKKRIYLQLQLPPQTQLVPLQKSTPELFCSIPQKKQTSNAIVKSTSHLRGLPFTAMRQFIKQLLPSQQKSTLKPIIITTPITSHTIPPRRLLIRIRSARSQPSENPFLLIGVAASNTPTPLSTFLGFSVLMGRGGSLHARNIRVTGLRAAGDGSAFSFEGHGEGGCDGLCSGGEEAIR
jgi:hypothetical protein